MHESEFLDGSRSEELFDRLCRDIENAGIEEESARDVTLRENWTKLLATMSQEHRAIVQECRRKWHDQLAAGEKDNIDNALFWACADMVFMAAMDVEARRKSPSLDMRPEIARVYLKDPHAIRLNICPGCKYRLPSHLPIPDDGKRPSYFEICPICGTGLGADIQDSSRNRCRDT